MGNSNNSLAQQLVPQPQSEVLDLDLPNSNATRAETVSNPSNQAVTSTPSLELPDNNDAAQSDTATVSSPRTATNPGASPSPGDGAQNGKVETSTTDLGSHAQQPATTVQSGGLTISEPLSLKSPFQTTVQRSLRNRIARLRFSPSPASLPEQLQPQAPAQAVIKRSTVGVARACPTIWQLRVPHRHPILIRSRRFSSIKVICSNSACRATNRLAPPHLLQPDRVPRASNRSTRLRSEPKRRLWTATTTDTQPVC